MKDLIKSIRSAANMNQEQFHQLVNDNISIKIRLFNKYGDEMSSAICNIPMK